MDMKNLVASSIIEAKEAAENLSRLKGFNLKSLQGLIACVKWSVKRAEEIGLSQNMSADEKKEFATELIMQVVPMPWYLAPIARSILPHIIDAIVDALKDKFGK
jgi:hypothetical protein